MFKLVVAVVVSAVLTSVVTAWLVRSSTTPRVVAPAPVGSLYVDCVRRLMEHATEDRAIFVCETEYRCSGQRDCDQKIKDRMDGKPVDLWK